MNNTSVYAAAPVSVCIIGVADLDKSLEFYAGTLGLDVADSGEVAGCALSKITGRSVRA